ncbi:uncharacterized protein LY89DRAFT_768563 [Mollisia scopiformis]|uniref:Mid2 domain-containing protein n=1 Tax=Mollisia scopiformis TaxID=149040 RepID=A0A194XQ62_MOLSC|nr:uncharacterized protein LY89DRAFT_768563 [Mollisia scopiformis]KUJ22194.1 hypothetical protein LY89DRAFT_768563 [Mollisia scopiformis]
MSSHSLREFEFLFALLSNVVLVSSTCYNPDGTAKTSPAYQPCVQTVGTFSQCCGTNWTATNPIVADDKCMPNGLCLNNNPSDNEPLYWRGSCTDPTWKSPLCLSNLCTNSSNGGDASDNVPLIQCSDGSWCCGSTNTACCSKGLGVKLDAIIGVANQSTSTSSTSSSTSTSTSTATGLVISATPKGTQSGLSTGAKAGIGVAAAVIAIIALAGLTRFILRKKRRQAAVRGPADVTSGGLIKGNPHELGGETAYAEMGSNKPEPYQHEVAGYMPVPVHELASSRYHE